MAIVVMVALLALILKCSFLVSYLSSVYHRKQISSPLHYHVFQFIHCAAKIRSIRWVQVCACMVHGITASPRKVALLSWSLLL